MIRARRPPRRGTFNVQRSTFNVQGKQRRGGKAAWRPGDPSGAFVNLAAMTDVMEMDSTFCDIEIIEDAIIANAKLKFGATSHTLVRENLQARAHFIYFALHHLANCNRQ